MYDEQDESLWNQDLISRGVFYLNQAATGDRISKYHLEANIAWWLTVKADSGEKWETILDLYNKLLILDYSPTAALNRTFALSKVKENFSKLIPWQKQLPTKSLFKKILTIFEFRIMNINLFCFLLLLKTINRH